MEITPNISVELIDAYLEAARVERGLALRTRQKYRVELVDLAVRGVDLEPDSVLLWAGSSKKGRELAPSTRNRRVAIVRGFCCWLVSSGRLERDPTATIRRVKVPRRRRVALRAPELRRLVATAREHDSWLAARDVAMVQVLFYTGLRLSELVALDLHQLDLASSVIRSARRKGGHVTDEYLPPAMVEAFRGYLKQRPEADTEALFLARHHTRLSPRAVQKRLALLGERAGLGHRVHPHALRHAHASALDEIGESIAVIQSSMNHASIATTRAYIHLSDSRLSKARNRLPRIAAGGQPP